MSPSDPKLTKEECSNLIIPSLVHATELKQCSLELYEKEHYPVAFSLYVLSLEEISKAMMCLYGAIGIYVVKRSDITSHGTKQRFLAHSMLTMSLFKWDKLADTFKTNFKDPKSKPISDDELPDELRDEMDEVLEFLMMSESMKESGFYIDIDEDGEPVMPDTIITKDSFPSFYMKSFGPFEINEGFLSNMTELSEFQELLMRPEVFSSLFPKTIRQHLSESITTTVKKYDEDSEIGSGDATDPE